MAPAAIYDSPVAAEQYHPAPVLAAVPVTVKGAALAIGSLVTAGDGKYQSLVSDLEGSRQVDRQMLDRLLDGGEFSISHFPLLLRFFLVWNGMLMHTRSLLLKPTTGNNLPAENSQNNL